MDLARRDDRLARALVTAYREAGGDPGDDALLRFFGAQRALIRAKVALIRAGQVEPADAARRRADAAELLDLADRLGWSVRLGDVAVVCGVAASGKSTLAAALAERAGATVISSDVVRKQLLGIDPTARAPAGAYADEVNRRTYDALGRLAWRRRRPATGSSSTRVPLRRRPAGVRRGARTHRAGRIDRVPRARVRAGRPRGTAGDGSAADLRRRRRAQWAARSRSGSRSTSYRPIGASPW